MFPINRSTQGKHRPILTSGGCSAEASDDDGADSAGTFIAARPPADTIRRRRRRRRLRRRGPIPVEKAHHPPRFRDAVPRTSLMKRRPSLPSVEERAARRGQRKLSVNVSLPGLGLASATDVGKDPPHSPEGLGARQEAEGHRRKCSGVAGGSESGEERDGDSRSRLEGFLEATGAIDVAAKIRVRDIWSPLPGKVRDTPPPHRASVRWCGFVSRSSALIMDGCFVDGRSLSPETPTLDVKTNTRAKHLPANLQHSGWGEQTTPVVLVHQQVF